jgi:hypothetical protein
MSDVTITVTVDGPFVVEGELDDRLREQLGRLLRGFLRIMSKTGRVTLSTCSSRPRT